MGCLVPKTKYQCSMLSTGEVGDVGCLVPKTKYQCSMLYQLGR